MVRRILMVDTDEEEYLHLKLLLEGIEGHPFRIDWLHHWDDLHDLEMADEHLVFLALNVKGNRLRKPGVLNKNELDDLKARFITMASHEFRTPLTSIASSADLAETYLKRGDFNGVGKHLARIKNSVGDLDAILADFLSLEKFENGQVHSIRRDINLPQLVGALCETFSGRLKTGQIIEYQHLGNEQVSLDPVLLKVALVNIISNASKYSFPEQPIRIYTQVLPEKITVSIVDQGIGISNDDRHQVFDRFHRGLNVANIQGTGLGLYLTKCYVEMMGGQIGYSSALEKGSTFWMEFPG